jgi:hypothetical protein
MDNSIIMALRTDIQLTTGGDLLIQNGDFVIGLSDVQHIKDTINAFPGWWKEFPVDGVGIINYLNGGDEQELEKNVRIQLTADGYQVGTPTVQINSDTVNINPDATRI